MGIDSNPPVCGFASRHLAAKTLTLGILMAFTLRPVYSAERQTKDYFDLSLEQLSEVEVTSVSRRPERLQDAAASIFVISADDIRRSGATTLPEALRIAPNLQVAQVSASAYAISARGANNGIGNKLLVLIDGRTVYSPLFSGVFWDAQDVMLEDVERIEVISGPGATLWGANAVNGVINVITRPARDTQGGLVAAGGGNTEAGTAFRYGGAFGSDGHYRVYGKGFNQFNTERAKFEFHSAGGRLQRGVRSRPGGQAHALRNESSHALEPAIGERLDPARPSLL